MNQQIENISKLIILYICALTLFIIIYYNNARSEIIDQIDNKLIVTVKSTREILGSDFHDNLVDEKSIGIDEDRKLAIKLYDFAHDLGVEYLYSFKRFDEEILFVVSGATEEEIASGSYNKVYFSEYPEMDDALVLAFDTYSTQNAEYIDRWGHFRSIFVPFKTNAGETYVIGADISIKKVKSAVFTSVAKSFGLAILLSLLFIPIFKILIKSARRESEVQYKLLFVDRLTGLPNRNQLLKDINHTRNTHLGLIEINEFSDVTNTYGPSIGDEVLKQFACRLNNYKHPDLLNYRSYHVGGNVFAILEDQELSLEQIYSGIQDLIMHMQSYQYVINNSECINLMVIIGGVNQKEDAYMLANMALEEAKKNNKPLFVFDKNRAFLPEVYKNNAEIKKQLQLAFDEDRLVPFFQPVFSAKDYSVVKYECLARVVDEQGAIEITPDIFLPVAKRARMYEEITRRILTKSIDAAKNKSFIVSINLNISDIMNGSMRHYIYKSVKNSKIANQIQFEILETEAIVDLVVVVRFIEVIQSLGAKVGIDDLGRSYSNFDRLIQLPVDFIKIDGLIITAIEHDVEAQSTVRQMVLMAHQNNIEVTAEYCHNNSTTKMAIRLGVNYLQGFYLGEPVSKPQKFINHSKRLNISRK